MRLPLTVSGAADARSSPPVLLALVASPTSLAKRLLLGRPFRSDKLQHTLLPKRIALPVFASDALSSVAYAPDEILLTLSIAGAVFGMAVEGFDGAHVRLMVTRGVKRTPNQDPRFVIGLGCELRYASRLVYARGFDLQAPDPTPIGVNCRLCERVACPQRAAPPLTRTLVVDEMTRGISPFVFDGPR